MLYFSRWKAAAILLTALIVCAFAAPNFVSPETIKKWPEWAQRYVVLGLDLQGGSHILLEVDKNDVLKQRLATLRTDVIKALRDARITWANPPVERNGGIEVRLREGPTFDTALTKLRDLSQPITNNIIGVTGQRTLEITNLGNGLVRIAPTEAAANERIRQTIEQAIPIIEKRVNGLGLVEPTIQRQGIDRVLVQVPGLGDPQQLIKLLGETAKLEFRLVNLSVPVQQAQQGAIPGDSEILCEATRAAAPGAAEPKPPNCEGGVPWLVYKEVLVEGSELTNAKSGFDQNGRPDVDF